MLSSNLQRGTHIHLMILHESQRRHLRMSIFVYFLYSFKFLCECYITDTLHKYVNTFYKICISRECMLNFLLIEFHNQKSWKPLIIVEIFDPIALYLLPPIRFALIKSTSHTNWMGSNFIFGKPNYALHYLF